MAKTVKYIQSMVGPASKNVGDTESLGDTEANNLVTAGFAVFLTPTASIYPTQVDDTDVGATVDMQVMPVARTYQATQLIGVVTGTTPSLTGKIQESADGSTWTDISGATFTAVTASDNWQVIRFTSTKRYLRHARTVTGTMPTFLLAATIQQVNPGSW